MIGISNAYILAFCDIRHNVSQRGQMLLSHQFVYICVSLRGYGAMALEQIYTKQMTGHMHKNDADDSNKRFDYISQWMRCIWEISVEWLTLLDFDRVLWQMFAAWS